MSADDDHVLLDCCIKKGKVLLATDWHLIAQETHHKSYCKGILSESVYTVALGVFWKAGVE